MAAHGCVISLPVAVIKDCDKSTEGRKSYLESSSKVHLSRGRLCCICSQEAERDKCWGSALLLLFIQSGIPSPSAAHIQNAFSYSNQYILESSAQAQSCVSRLLAILDPVKMAVLTITVTH